ncbi:MAG: PRC-barrel domain-containing protein, partial [Chloroflexota bacterium]
MEEREFQPIEPGMDVCDRDATKIGSVAHVHDGGPGGGSPYDAGFVEVKTGFMGLGKRYYIPMSAIHDVTEGGVFLSGRRGDLNLAEWGHQPSALAGPAATPEVTSPRQEVVRPEAETETVTARPAGAASAAGQAQWEEVMPRYRARWEQHYGAQGAHWEVYEPRYHYAWEMGRLPEYSGRSWYGAQADLRQEWEARHPDTTWDQVADTIRDAWEHAQE